MMIMWVMIVKIIMMILPLLLRILLLMIRIMLTIKMLIIIMKMGQWMKMECKIMNRDKEEDE